MLFVLFLSTLLKRRLVVIHTLFMENRRTYIKLKENNNNIIETGKNLQHSNDKFLKNEISWKAHEIFEWNRLIAKVYNVLVMQK